MPIFDSLTPELNKVWYQIKDKDMVAPAVLTTAEEIEHDQASLRQSWKEYARAYSNRREMGLDWNLDSSQENIETFVTENVTKSVIDTAASIIAKNRVRPRILTNGSDFKEQRKARRLEKFLYSEMKSQKAWELGPSVFRDACIFGTGVVKVFGRKKKMFFERKLISDILVDERGAIDGKPQELFERRIIDKNVLMSLFPKFETEIELAAGADSWAGSNIPKSQVVVVEAWRLPTDTKPGRHVIVANKVLLHDETYTDTYFPFVFFRWDGLPVSGFYGLGLARDLHGIQSRINNLNKFIEQCQDMIAVPRVFVDMSSKLLKVHLDDRIGAIIPYRGKPPTFFTPTALNAEIYNYKEQLKRSAFEFAGISQLSAQSLKPAGLESAVALREYSDIETNRFVIQSQRYEKLFTDLGEMTINIAAKLFKNGVDTTARFPNKNVLELIKWSDVDLERDRFEIDIQPASLLSMSPSARLQAVTELAQVGQLDRAEIRYLLQHPDVEHSNDIASADYKDATRVEQLLLDGEYEPPEPFQNIDLIQRRLQLTYLWLQTEYTNVPEEILENIRTYISQTKSLAEQAVQAGVPAAPVDPALAGGQAPLAGGVAGSDVIQNLPGQIANV